MSNFDKLVKALVLATVELDPLEQQAQALRAEALADKMSAVEVTGARREAERYIGDLCRFLVSDEDEEAMKAFEAA